MSELKKNIFITGGSGFLGRHFLQKAKAAGFQFYVLTRERSRIEKLRNSSIVEVLQGDLTDIEKFNMQLSQCAYFIHMAGEKSDEGKMHATNVGSLKIILNVLKSFPQIRFMHMSSTGVYGIWNQPEVMLTEDLPCYPENLYERTKLEAEEVILSFSKTHDFRYVILRPSNVFGENDESKKLLTLMQTIKKGIFFEVDSLCMVNYVYVNYVIEVVLAVLKKDLFNNEIYNVNTPISLTKFTGLIKDELGIIKSNHRLPNWFILVIANLSELLPNRLRIIDKVKYAALTNKKIYPSDKLETVLNIDGVSSLREGIKKLVDYYKRNKWL